MLLQGAGVKKHIKNNPNGALFTGLSGREITRPDKVAKALNKGSDVIFISSPKRAGNIAQQLKAYKYTTYTLNKVMIASRVPLVKAGEMYIYKHTNGRRILLDVSRKTEGEMLKVAEVLKPQDPDFIVFRRKDKQKRFVKAPHMNATIEETKIGKGTVTLHLLDIPRMPPPTTSLVSQEQGVFKLIIYTIIAITIPLAVVYGGIMALKYRAKKLEPANL